VLPKGNAYLIQAVKVPADPSVASGVASREDASVGGTVAKGWEQRLERKQQEEAGYY